MRWERNSQLTGEKEVVLFIHIIYPQTMAERNWRPLVETQRRTNIQ